MKLLARFFLRYELGMIGMAGVTALLFYLAYGLVPAVRMFVGSLLVIHLALLWVFRAALVASARRLISRKQV
jgi:hypothetical protein